MRKFFSFGILAVLAIATSVCLADCGGSPTAPSKCDDPKATNYGAPAACVYPTSGTINIVYQRPAGMTCLSAGTQFADRCDSQKAPVMVTTEYWPTGYGFAGLKLVADTNGSFTVSAVAPTTPPPGQLGIYVVDSWLCPPAYGCSNIATGKGIIINGTMLKGVGGEGEGRAYFSFVPPTVTAVQ